MIVKDEKFLRQKSEKITSLEEIKDIEEKLKKELFNYSDGVGLSAIQIGIPKQVCIVNVKQMITLVNPRVTETNGEVGYMEGCLSFPGKTVRTKRFKEIVVETDYLRIEDEEWRENVKVMFAPSDIIAIEHDNNMLESIVIQHEIDHLNGVLMFDREWKIEKLSHEKVGRNDPCPCGKMINGNPVKYKKCCGKL